MAVDLEALIATESNEQQALSQDVAKGVASQAKLAQVEATLAELSALKARREALKTSVVARVAAAKAKAVDANTKLGLVATMLNALPGTLTLAKLDAIVAADLASPPDPTLKTHAKYVEAMTTATDAADAATFAAEQARDDEANALAEVDRLQTLLEVTLKELVTPAEQAAAAAAEALQARSSGDFARAYWSKRRADALIAVANTAALATAVTAAQAALSDAFDAFAEAKNERLTADATAAAKQAARAKAADQLGTASAAVLATLLAAVVAAKAQP